MDEPEPEAALVAKSKKRNKVAKENMDSDKPSLVSNYYPISNIDTVMDMHGTFGEIDLPLDPVDNFSPAFVQLKSFVNLLVGIVPASLFYAAKELGFFLYN